jgi:hypothetical protein
MGRSSEEFIKQREGELNSLPITQDPFSWRLYFEQLGNQYNKHEKQDM